MTSYAAHSLEADIRAICSIRSPRIIELFPSFEGCDRSEMDVRCVQFNEGLKDDTRTAAGIDLVKAVAALGDASLSLTFTWKGMALRDCPQQSGEALYTQQVLSGTFVLGRDGWHIECIGKPVKCCNLPGAYPPDVDDLTLVSSLLIS